MLDIPGLSCCHAACQVGDHVSQDTRVKWLQREWFEGKACLDIGCNEGALTIYIGAT